jgi:hypothetical protein
MKDQTILERFNSRCPVCNHNEVHKDDEPTWDYWGVTCGYCAKKWETIFDYETDCELKEGEWVLEDKIEILENKIKNIRDLFKKAPKSEGIFRDEDNSGSEGMPVCSGLMYDYDEISTFLTKLKTILDS